VLVCLPAADLRQPGRIVIEEGAHAEIMEGAGQQEPGECSDGGGSTRAAMSAGTLSSRE
jgi:hypothetical protein